MKCGTLAHPPDAAIRGWAKVRPFSLCIRCFEALFLVAWAGKPLLIRLDARDTMKTNSKEVGEDAIKEGKGSVEHGNG